MSGLQLDGARPQKHAGARRGRWPSHRPGDPSRVAKSVASPRTAPRFRLKACPPLLERPLRPGLWRLHPRHHPSLRTPRRSLTGALTSRAQGGALRLRRPRPPSTVLLPPLRAPPWLVTCMVTCVAVLGDLVGCQIDLELDST